MDGDGSAWQVPDDRVASVVMATVTADQVATEATVTTDQVATRERERA